ncbi:MAG TPA: EamA family transporter [Geminicoccaceae bacterium]|nr:EamA family transporter [Geminicoccaceae bacterium]
MDPAILGLVLLAAMLHASWNALVKVGGDPFVRLAVLNVASGLCALPLLFLLAVPAAASWPFLLGSVAIHFAYFVTLAYGYRSGDLSYVYPIARGIAPPLVAVGAWLTAGESPGPLGALAILVISGAIASLALTPGRRLMPPTAVWFALATGLSIAGYTVCDGLGGRAAGDVLAYIAWLFVLNAVPFALIVGLRRRRDLARQLGSGWRAPVVGGVFAVAAYGLVIWAMSRAPMASVSALRETSVVMAALIGTRLLREPFGTRRVVAASVVALGVVLLEIGPTF